MGKVERDGDPNFLVFRLMQEPHLEDCTCYTVMYLYMAGVDQICVHVMNLAGFAIWDKQWGP